MAETHSMSGMSMENAFYSSSELIDLLFKGFTVTSLGGFIGVLVGIASVSILYEGLRQVRDFFLNRFVDTRKQSLIYQYQQQQLQPSTSTSGGAQRRKRDRRGTGESGSGSTKRCDSIRYVNINKRSPIDDEADTIGPGGDAPSRPSVSPSLDPDPEPGPSSALVPHQQVPVSDVRIRVEDLVLATLLHMVYITIGYMLMLAVMTFNVWILASVTVGVGIGYLMFGTFRRLDHLATHKRITIVECCAEEGEGNGSGGGGGDRAGGARGGSSRAGGGGGGARGLNPREDSVGPEGPLLASASNSCSSSHASDAGGIGGYGSTSQVKTPAAVDEDEDGNSRTMVIHKDRNRQRQQAGH